MVALTYYFVALIFMLVLEQELKHSLVTAWQTAQPGYYWRHALHPQGTKHMLWCDHVWKEHIHINAERLHATCIIAVTYSMHHCNCVHTLLQSHTHSFWQR